MKIDAQAVNPPQYMDAYAACLGATGTVHAPWYAVPADDEENARLVFSQVLVETLDALRMRHPASRAGAGELARMRKRLQA